MNDRMIWLDIETFGLRPGYDPVIEIGFVITDLDMIVTDELQIAVWNRSREERYQELKRKVKTGAASDSEAFIFDMHTKNGLFAFAREMGKVPGRAAETMISFLSRNKISSEPLCGSSVHFDRTHLDAGWPYLLENFSYRNIDISSLKELCMRFNPHMYSKMQDDVRLSKSHRVISDIEDSIEEFKWYRDNFLWIDELNIT